MSIKVGELESWKVGELERRGQVVKSRKSKAKQQPGAFVFPAETPSSTKFHLLQVSIRAREQWQEASGEDGQAGGRRQILNKE
jgi:hypothetical protein